MRLLPPSLVPFLLALAAATAQAQSTVATGVVTDVGGHPALAWVGVVGTSVRVQTSADGSYRLCDVPLGTIQLFAAGLGYAYRLSEPVATQAQVPVLWFPALLTVPVVLDSIQILPDSLKRRMLVPMDSIPEAVRHLGRCRD